MTTKSLAVLYSSGHIDGIYTRPQVAGDVFSGQDV